MTWLWTIIIGMLVSGTLSTIATKFQDQTTIDGEKFDHPAFQSLLMFAGEALCLIAHFGGQWWWSRRQTAGDGLSRKTEMGDPEAALLAPLLADDGPGAYTSLPGGSGSAVGDADTAATAGVRLPPLRVVVAFGLPALCDATGSTLLNIGLFYTQASTYQMLRGSQVLFAGLLTVTFLHRRLQGHHWLGMALVTAGAAVCGYASMVAATAAAGAPPGVPPPPLEPWSPPPEGRRALLSVVESVGRGVTGSSAANLVMVGNCLVVIAQLCSASQFVIEERFLKADAVPAALAVGIEGVWGLLICTIALVVLGHVNGPSGRPLDSAALAVRQAMASGPLMASLIASIAGIAVFNFCGVSITKALSGASRATIDATRTIFVWGASLLLGWESFTPLQLVGFALLLLGSALYNELLRPPSAPVVFAAFTATAIESSEEPPASAGVCPTGEDGPGGSGGVGGVGRVGTTESSSEVAAPKLPQPHASPAKSAPSAARGASASPLAPPPPSPTASVATLAAVVTPQRAAVPIAPVSPPAPVGLAGAALMPSPTAQLSSMAAATLAAADAARVLAAPGGGGASSSAAVTVSAVPSGGGGKGKKKGKGKK